jgi:hypothetical protein
VESFVSTSPGTVVVVCAKLLRPASKNAIVNILFIGYVLLRV